MKPTVRKSRKVGLENRFAAAEEEEIMQIDEIQSAIHPIFRKYGHLKVWNEAVGWFLKKEEE